MHNETTNISFVSAHGPVLMTRGGYLEEPCLHAMASQSPSCMQILIARRA